MPLCNSRWKGNGPQDIKLNKHSKGLHPTSLWWTTCPNPVHRQKTCNNRRCPITRVPLQSRAEKADYEAVRRGPQEIWLTTSRPGHNLHKTHHLHLHPKTRTRGRNKHKGPTSGSSMSSQTHIQDPSPHQPQDQQQGCSAATPK